MSDSSLKTILFVDDDVSVLAAMQRLLRKTNPSWKLEFAQGAHEAINRLMSTHVDALVTDVAMPGMSGLELLSHIVEGNYGFLPVIVVTGMMDKDAKRRALELGAQDLLSKPLDYEDLVARLRSVLALKNYHDELSLRNAQLEDLVAARTEELAASRLELVIQLSKAAELRDQTTGDHVLRVGLFARTIGAALGLSHIEQNDLLLAATLHDIGKIAVPDSLLRKQGHLKPDERKVMETHCEIGYTILTSRESGLSALLPDGMHLGEQPRILQLAADIARCHHEWWDGSGYPKGLKGPDIPFPARIVALADVLDALRSERPYKTAISWSRAIETIAKNRGTQFDPEIHDAFLSVEPDMKRFDAEARLKEIQTMAVVA